ncbi:FUSC family protein [Stakelama marina]|uniref:FUSC family protein n=1 Tax=Stakelama marina TaxID=2826939 RepID=A0A8T4IGN9_9SPHN|nr:FUSC family protein [Stakelama marina]MBR0553651.1 FUSC family protein [Stakelama marina]
MAQFIASAIEGGVPTLLTLVVNAMPWPLRRRLVRADPGMQRTARASRAMFAFLLTLATALLVGRVVSVSVLSFLIAFPVTVFCCAAIGDDETRARIGKTAALAAAAGAAFTLSSLLHTPWINHAVFILVIGAMAYMRQYAGPWAPVAIAANVSYFFGSFLKPDPTTLHWQWVGVVIGAACALIVHQLVVPHRPWRRMRWSAASIRMRLAHLLRTAAALDAPEESLAVRRSLRGVADAVRIAENELENLPGGRLAHRPLAEALIRTLVLAERLALQAKGVIGDGLSAEERAAAKRLSAALVANDELPREGDSGDIADALNELERALHLPPDHAAARSVDAPPPAPTNAILRPAVQSAAAAALAIIGGNALSPERWYWAVITVFVMFTGTYSRGQALFKSLQRTVGTLGGILVAMAIVWAVNGDTRAVIILMPVAIFCIFYAFLQAYTWMAFWITIVVGLLFSSFGEFTDRLMVLRLEETAIGAVAGIVVAALVLPRSTAAHARDQFNDLADAIDKVIDEALPGGPLNRLTLTAALHDFETTLSDLRDAIEPLRLIPLQRATEQRSRLHRQLVLTSYWVHEIALAVRQLDSAGVAQAPAPAAEAATALHERLKRLRNADTAPEPAEDDNAPAPDDTSPAATLATACHGAAEAMTAAARLLTDRSQQTRAFRF